ncbi:DUF2073 domain-containing protein [Candidatus Woesearchaeota archaeon]|nr:DUF2073 domain-containing protein [Candidatus Woesearchaeota archaeon]
MQYIPYHELVGLPLDDKIKKILKSVKDDRIILIEGRLAPFEESELIKRTMEQIDRKFKGIEICSVDYGRRETDVIEILRKRLAHFLLRRNEGLTIIGPATLVKEIKKDPNKIELLTLDKKR